jgi:hypothetical protein
MVYAEHSKWVWVFVLSVFLGVASLVLVILSIREYLRG